MDVAPRLTAVVVPSTNETAAIVGQAPAPLRPLGGSELHVSPLALSARAFGITVPPALAGELLDAYVLRGGNLVDASGGAPDGRGEVVIGAWLALRGRRDQLVLATGVGRSGAHPGLSTRAIAASVEASLRRLGTDRIDLLVVEADDPEVEYEETLLAIDELIRAGKVRRFAATRPDAEHVIAARVAAAQLGIAPMLAIQTEYHLLARREYEGALATIVAQQGLAVLPRRALAGGLLAGTRLPRGRGGRPQLARRPGRRGARVLAALDRIAGERQTAVATVALAWLLSKPHVAAPAMSVASVEQLFGLMAAGELRLSRHEVADLDRASA